jgi:hypothetical protein
MNYTKFHMNFHVRGLINVDIEVRIEIIVYRLQNFNVLLYRIHRRIRLYEYEIEDIY